MKCVLHRLGRIVALILALSPSGIRTAHAQRLLGIDVSAWQNNITAANWATLKRATNQQVSGIYGDGRDFVLIRSSRGGTTGYYDQNDSSNANGLNTLSQRYDDPYYIQNINRATAAGLFAGSYHFARPEIIASTPNSGGIANTGSDEADHFIQMAGPWMRPGYLPPVLDLESGQAQRTSSELTSFCNDFSDRIYQVMQIRPAIYINGNYANYVQSSIVAKFPQLWTARWPNQTNPAAILVQTAQPKDSYSPIYGPWDDPPNPTHPWTFWQYASTAHVNAIGNGTANCDVDAVQGGMEFLKDQLIPAIWLTNSDGQWTTLTNWNSGLTPALPVPGPGQVAPIGTLTLPTPRLPGSNDTVILDRPSASVTLTLSSGTHNIRKLYMREALNITGGSLTINYVPTADSTPISAQFSGPVVLGGGSVSVHTLQVDESQTFTLNGGTLALNTLNLMPNSSAPAKLLIGGTVTFSALNAGCVITNGVGAGKAGYIDLGGAARSIAVASGDDLIFGVAVTNGGLTKVGAGALHLSATNTYTGDTVVGSGLLKIEAGGSIASSANVVVSNGATFDISSVTNFKLAAGQALSGNGSIAGAATILGTVSPGTSIGTLSFNSDLILSGATIMALGRNGATLVSDKINCGGTLAYGGSLMVTNVGTDPFLDGDTFQIFNAATNAGAFASTNLPTLPVGFRWDTSALGSGLLKVAYVGVGQPLFHSISNTGANLILQGTNGVAGSPYYLLSTTNILLPLSSWTRVTTNYYGPGGSFSNLVPVDSDENGRFYLLQTPQ